MSSPSRKSPRLLARQEAAQQAAKCIASAVRSRVWCEARTLDEPPRSYYYNLQSGATAWTLPEGAILRSAGRDSLIPRPGDPISRQSSFARSSSMARQSSSKTRSSVASVTEEATGDSGAANTRTVSPTEVAVGAAVGADAIEGGPPLELHEVLQLLFSWLQDTRALYAESRADLEQLRTAHADDVRSAQGAIAQLARKHASYTKCLKEELALVRKEAATAKEAAAASMAAGSPRRRASFEEMNVSSWAAEVERLRDGLRKAEAQLVHEREARELLLQEQAEADRLRAEAAAAREQAEAAEADAGAERGSEALHEELAQLREQLSASISAASEAAEARQAAQNDAQAARDEAAAALYQALTAQVAVKAAEGAAREAEVSARAEAAASFEEAHASALAAVSKCQADTERASSGLIRSEWRFKGERAKVRLAEAKASEAAARAGAVSNALEHLRLKHAKTLEELDEYKGSVRVLCRLRPLKAGNEEARGPSAVVAPPPPEGGPSRSIVVQAPNASQTVGGSIKSFEFDGVFAPEASSASVFEELQPLTRKVAAGATAAILAYGQTGSGKTYTVSALHNLALRELWAGEAANGGSAALAVSLAEVYMDEVRDLGRPADPIPAVGTKFAFGSAVASAGATPRSSEVDASTLTWTTVTSAEAACALVTSALERRVTADNGLNSVSSRSHLIIFYALLGPRGERKGQLALVDLAGSERLGRTEATGGLRDEAISINRSLTALGDVLHALVGKTEHVPYRHSKLTTLLQPCLKRGARVALIIAASPSSEDALETLQTLGFGVRARNVHLGPMASLSAAAGGTAGGGLQKEVARLQKELVEAKAQAAAHERSLASFKQQASSTDEAARGKSEAIKRADAKAKEAEHALKRSEAAAHAERSRLLKEMEELQRKLDVATSRARRPERPEPSAPAALPQALSATTTARQPRLAEAKKEARAPAAEAPKPKQPSKAVVTATKAGAAPAKAATAVATAVATGGAPADAAAAAEVAASESAVAEEVAAEAFAALPTCQAADEGSPRWRVSCAAAAVCMGYACSCGAYDEVSHAEGGGTEAPPAFLTTESLPYDSADMEAAALMSFVGHEAAALLEAAAAAARAEVMQEASQPSSSPRGTLRGTDNWPQQVLKRLSAVQDSVMPPGAPLSPRRASLLNMPPSQAGAKPATVEVDGVSDGWAVPSRRESGGSSSVISGLSATNESTIFAHRLNSAREAFNATPDMSLDAWAEPSDRSEMLDTSNDTSLRLSTSPLVAHLNELLAEGKAEQVGPSLDVRLAATDSMEDMVDEMLASARATTEDTSHLEDRPYGKEVADSGAADEIHEQHLAVTFALPPPEASLASPASAPRTTPRHGGSRPSAPKTPGSQHSHNAARTPASASAKAPLVPRFGLTPGSAKPQRRPLQSTPSSGAPLTCPSRVLVRAQTAGEIVRAQTAGEIVRAQTAGEALSARTPTEQRTIAQTARTPKAVWAPPEKGWR